MATYAASIPIHEHAKRSLGALVRLSEAGTESAKSAGIDPVTLEFVKLRASLVNGCGYCIHMHAHDARELGVAEERLVAVADWEHSDRFDAEERAALALTDAVTRQSEGGGIDPTALTAAAEVFGDEVASHLVMAATVINAWNRIGVAAALAPDPAWGDAPRAA